MSRPRCGEEGSALLLFPAALLVLVVLGAMAVDFSIAFLGERELANATAAAANDAVAEAVSNRDLYRRGLIVLDGPTAARLAEEHVRRALDPDRYRNLRVHSVVDPSGSRLSVTAWAEVDYLFAAAVPGAPRVARVQATSSASPRRMKVLEMT